MDIFEPGDWYWVVGNDASRAWSSKARAWVAEWPPDRRSAVNDLAELDAALRRCTGFSPFTSADDVRDECQRRIFALLGVTSMEKCTVKQLNAQMRATELTDKRVAGEALSPAETAEAAALRALAAEIKRLRAVSNSLEPSPPADYRNESYWIA